ncbi:divalent-cation tolerance protein CutA [Phytohabitans sp. ZYX-F-186]|uniref:Divalent-cation tolerance protein CutA n=1 Tax=Phytohabitans maris TaxID=3071409 RepID=A0ABU0ZCN3_9ACTN|nr:divalent-cation tolerance protein CutA [Phytohabitans sp. ZYX-F-186]MDQ7904826.1 divalent-cation tolerance protein CutA [Phytohabitans sp. ZYX-F-186]
MTDDICQVIITAPNSSWLADFVHTLVNERLCASGHNLAEIRSIYRWQGSIEDRTEAHAALHTRTALVATIINRTNELHPYEVPCVVALPITAANPAYRQWILEETRPVTGTTATEN